ncbi:hypothetical protein VTJ83DRAFT_2472 [Remersonia thermophila]|uniref:Integral membrane protein n=1 Tax=Remersonia thermophila TaxID=72144 RepID=A0ABR4DIV7_9PEZI
METTLFPVAALPTCVTSCGVLFDVNGACVPPAKPTANAITYGTCFCDDPRVTPFATGTTGVCDEACAANPNDLTAIRNWYTSYCDQVKAAATSTTRQPSGGGGTWLDNHYQWVIFLVIMVVAIVGIWVGACVWRRRYLRKKDREYALGTNLARATESGRIVPHDSTASVHLPRSGLFNPAPISSAGVYGEKEAKPAKKWRIRSRE